MNKRNDKNSNAVLIGPLLASEVLLNNIIFRKSNVYDFLKEIANRLDSCCDISATSPDSLFDLKQKFNELVSNLTKRNDENIDDDDTTLDDLLQQCIAECERVFGRQITTISNSVSQLSTNVSGLPSRVSTISNSLASAKSDISRISNDVRTISTSVGTLSNKVNSLPTNLGTLSSSISTISTNLSTLSSSVSGLPTKVSTISNSLASAISNISNISANIGTLTSSVSTLTSDLASEISNLNIISSDIGDFKTTVNSNLSKKINYSDLRDLSADGLTDNNPARAKDVKRYVSEISDKIGELSAKIDLIDPSQSIDESTISEISTRLFTDLSNSLEDMINARVMEILTHAAHDISDYYVTVDGEQYRLKFEKVIDLAQAVANIVDGIESGEIRDQNGDAYEFVTMASNDELSQDDYEGFPDVFIELDNYVLSQTNNHIMLQTGSGGSSNSLIYDGSNSLESAVIDLINDGFEVNSVDYQIMLKKKDD